jgi:RNA polymerase sigma factor (sigma-70 family)
VASDPVSAALERVLVQFDPIVRSVARKHGLGASDVDEVMQEVRFRIWRARIDSEALGAAQASYVYLTAVSAARDLLRRRRRAERESEQMPARALRSALRIVIDDYPDAESPLRVLEASELERALEAAVAHIVRSRRDVVRLYLRGYSLSEIARAMRWTEAKTRSLLYRGLATVRAELTSLGYGPNGHP